VFRFRQRCLTFDRRTLALTRILLGLLLVFDLFHRGRWWTNFYSFDGVCPNAWSVAKAPAWGYFSLFHAFSTHAELAVLWSVMFVTSVALLVGYRTRVAQLAALVFVTSMNARVLLVENGGYVVENLLLLWTAVLPLGDRFSLDALLASMRRRHERTATELDDRDGYLTNEQRAPFESIVVPAILLQIAAIYLFNFLHKTGSSWKDGTAVHYVFYITHYGTPLGGALRDRLPTGIVAALTRATLATEAIIPFAVLSPVGGAWPRRLAVTLICALHIGFGIVLTLGPFSWSCCVLASLLVCRADWEVVFRVMRRPARRRVVVVDLGSPTSLSVCRVLSRLDGFGLLTFREGDVPTRGVDFAPVVAALPLGPLVAWLFRLPRFARLVEATIAAFARYVSADVAPPLPSSVPRFRGLLREAVAAALLLAFVNELLASEQSSRPTLHLPYVEAARAPLHELRIFQDWGMWAPEPPKVDGTLVVDALTVDGRHIDPFQLERAGRSASAPNFDLVHTRSLGLGQMWGMYFERVHDRAPDLWPAMVTYLRALPRRTGHPEDALVSADVYWVSVTVPGPTRIEPHGYERLKLFSFDSALPAVDSK
jgi:Vitamin K-dependent gamma-carboxylase